MQITKNGTVYNFALDIEKICQAEEADPAFNFFKYLAEAGDNVRLSSIVRLAGFIEGTDYKSLISDGWTFDEIGEIIAGSVQDLGFMSAPTD